MDTERVAFGGGCFWCTEAVFLELRGVVSVTPGYAGGTTEHPTYEAVSTGKTGHAEVILVEYDPQQISFRDLLDVFFASHDPTQLNRQGADIGTQYRSVILYSTDEQQKEATGAIATLEASGTHQKPIVTKVEPLKAFYPAEAYHEKYYATHPDAPYASVVIAPKVAKVRERYANLLRE